jgi:hypothetical protein
MRDKNTPGTDAKEFVEKNTAEAVINALESSVDDLNDEILAAREAGYTVDLEINDDDLVEINVAEGIDDGTEAATEENTGD